MMQRGMFAAGVVQLCRAVIVVALTGSVFVVQAAGR